MDDGGGSRRHAGRVFVVLVEGEVVIAKSKGGKAWVLSLSLSV